MKIQPFNKAKQDNKTAFGNYVYLHIANQQMLTKIHEAYGLRRNPQIQFWQDHTRGANAYYGILCNGLEKRVLKSLIRLDLQSISKEKSYRNYAQNFCDHLSKYSFVDIKDTNDLDKALKSLFTVEKKRKAKAVKV